MQRHLARISDVWQIVADINDDTDQLISGQEPAKAVADFMECCPGLREIKSGPFFYKLFRLIQQLSALLHKSNLVQRGGRQMGQQLLDGLAMDPDIVFLPATKELEKSTVRKAWLRRDSPRPKIFARGHCLSFR
jgi:hypothetical protein